MTADTLPTLAEARTALAAGAVDWRAARVLVGLATPDEKVALARLMDGSDHLVHLSHPFSPICHTCKAPTYGDETYQRRLHAPRER